MSKSFYYFTASNALSRIAFELVGVFGILDFYVLFGNSLIISFSIFSLIYILYPLFAFFVVPIIQKFGTKKSILIGIALTILSVIPLGYVYTKNWLIIALWVILTTASKVFFYIPFHYYSVKYTQGKQMGKQISFINIMLLLSQIIAPILGGFVTQFAGLGGIAVLTMFFAILSVFPLLKIEDYRIRVSRRIFDLIYQPEIQQSLKILFVDQIQAKENFWSLFIFIFVGSSFSNYGILMSVIMFGIVPLLFYFGRFSDHHNKKFLLKIQGVITSFLWFIRLAVNNLIGIIVVDAIHKVNYQVRSQTMGLILYDLANKQNQDNLLDEKLIIRESFDNLFYGLMMLIGVVIAYFFGFSGVFFISGLTALLFVAV